MQARIHRTGDVLQGSGFTLAAYVEGHTAGTPVVQADITSINVSQYLVSAPTVLLDSSALTVSEVVFDVLQTGGIWEDIDDIGYNFKWSVPASWMTGVAGLYRFEFLVDPVTGENFYFACNTNSLNMFSV